MDMFACILQLTCSSKQWTPDAGVGDICARYAHMSSIFTTNSMVNGLCMGRGIAVYKVGTPNCKGLLMVIPIVLNRQVYLNPHLFFDATVKNWVLDNEGEHVPFV
jgi:hypothetical protein